MPEESSRGGGADTRFLKRVSHLMLEAPSDVSDDGDALTPLRAGELLGCDRRDVSNAWRALLSEWSVRVDSLAWGKLVRRVISDLEGVATLREVAAGAASMASGRPDAYALTRVLIESGADAALVWRRSGRQVLIATEPATLEKSAHSVIDHAAELRHVASALLVGGEIVSTERLLGAVALSPELQALTHLTPARLTSLVAALSPHVLSNRRGDLYLAGLRPAYALAAVASSLPDEVSIEEVRRRVRGRFPGASPLPDDDELRPIIDDAVGLARGSGPARAVGVSDGQSGGLSR